MSKQSYSWDFFLSCSPFVHYFCSTTIETFSLGSLWVESTKKKMSLGFLGLVHIGIIKPELVHSKLTYMNTVIQNQT